MKVKDLMTAETGFCKAGATLLDAARVMKEKGCGVVPVVDAQRKILGVLTDRDVCLALATRNLPASAIRVEDAATRPPRVCGPEDDVRTALETMARHQVSRLPVVGKDGSLAGIVSVTDVVLSARRTKAPRGAVTYQDAVQTLERIWERTPIARRKAAAERERVERAGG